ncbi:MAG: gephyrin-like molybdotransferase Glp [Hyphomicrobiales bacterium]
MRPTRGSRPSGGHGAPLIAPSRALRLLLTRTKPMPVIEVPLAEALGRVVARAIRAPHDLPRFASSAMDGYAVASAATRSATRRTPARLRLVGRTIFAGGSPGPAVGDGAAIRIMTGAPLPRGVDAVVPQEEVLVTGRALELARPSGRGRHVRRSGGDCSRGDRVVTPGEPIHPGTLALLAALGIRRIRVRRPPRITLVVTGDEVRPPSTRAIPRYATRDCHATFLTAALGEFGIAPRSVAYARDSERALRQTLSAALARADLVIATGGVSVGDRDLVRPVLRSLGARTIFWRVAQRPGKPLYFGRRRSAAVLGLPGNPASTVVCYCEYVRPAILRMLGASDAAPERWWVRLSSAVRRDPVRTGFIRGRLERHDLEWRARPSSRQGSNLLGSFLESDCVILVPPGRGSLRAGARVRVHALPWWRA